MENMSHDHGGFKNGVGLPMSRVKIIMKSSPDVDHISPDALFAMTKATELFVSHLTLEAMEKTKGQARSVDYKSLADVVNTDEIFGFLQEVVPYKITYRDYLKLMNSTNSVNNEGSEEDTTDTDSSSGSSDSEGPS